ncbi:pentatricopeptide repeat-containing protein At5g44230-like [Alnus glutinosa]|uniref:pentatricopeptide repeat-containing protein At5g44230-like n=1 Tax=Alnus glutinosa TaxID=3517 RepID=UPI002D7A0B9D|nr:pentatricopeptide repeat-containing protein At5g44230-like [Alnus glutinosa]
MLGVSIKPLPRHENAVIQTGVVACYGLAFGRGFDSYLIALDEQKAELIGVVYPGTQAGDFKHPGLVWMIGFLFLVSLLVLFSLVPLRQVFDLVSKLPYPFGTATPLFHINTRAALAGKQVRWPMTVMTKQRVRNVVSWPELIVTYAKSRDMESAGDVFHELLVKDVVAWATMVTGYAQLNTPMAALEFFTTMHIPGMGPTGVTLVRILSACAPLGAEKYANWVRDIVEKCGFGPAGNVVVGSALFDIYSKLGSWVHSWEVFIAMAEIENIGLPMHGHGKAAIRLLTQLEKIGIQPGWNTFFGFLGGCTHAALVTKGR